jgi:hypothetical protein
MFSHRHERHFWRNLLAGVVDIVDIRGSLPNDVVPATVEDSFLGAGAWLEYKCRPLGLESAAAVP